MPAVCKTSKAAARYPRFVQEMDLHSFVSRAMTLHLRIVMNGGRRGAGENSERLRWAHMWLVLCNLYCAKCFVYCCVPLQNIADKNEPFYLKDCYSHEDDDHIIGNTCSFAPTIHTTARRRRQPRASHVNGSARLGRLERDLVHVCDRTHILTALNSPNTYNSHIPVDAVEYV
jgi:hypothetical protein